MPRLAVVVIVFLGVGCPAATGVFRIPYEFVDVPQERRIELIYRNDSEDPVCLVPEFWPNEAGKIDQASDLVFLVVGDQRFPIEEFNTGYCPGCVLRVEPGETVRATIEYSSFGVPDALVNEGKHLDFSPMASHCSRRDGKP